MFADDILYYREVISEDDHLAVQCDVQLIADWIHSKGLQLNAKKCKFMVITRKRHPPKVTITIDGETLEHIIYLGVTIQDDLSWSLHISTICSKARRLLGFLYRNFRMANSGCLSYLYRSLVLPVLDYCGAVWDPHHAHNIQKLERVQHFAARLTTGQWAASGSSLCDLLGWSPLARRRVYQHLCLCRRILTGGSLVASLVCLYNSPPHFPLLVCILCSSHFVRCFSSLMFVLLTSCLSGLVLCSGAALTLAIS